jgi:aminomethyltransferase
VLLIHKKYSLLNKTMAKLTPLHERTAKLCESYIWVHWAGYVLPGVYIDSVQDESIIIRETAALIDVSPFQKYYFKGPDAKQVLNRVFTRNIDSVEIDHGIYVPWCDPDGKVRQDGTVFRLAEDYYLVCATEPDLPWFQNAAVGYDVEIQDKSAAEAVIALQGPNSYRVLQEVTSTDCSQLKYFGLTRSQIAGHPCLISRTGYGGDLGYELWVAAEDAIQIWDTLLANGDQYQLKPCGLLALDVARVEAGYLLPSPSQRTPLMGALMGYGDYVRTPDADTQAQKVTPFEIDMGWAVDLKKTDFIGREALLAEQSQGGKWQFIGVEIEREPFEALYTSVGLVPDYPPKVSGWIIPLYAGEGGRQVGHVTSRVWSKYLNSYIALGFVEPQFGMIGTELMMECTVLYERRMTPVKVASTPFFNSPRLRAVNLSEHESS